MYGQQEERARGRLGTVLRGKYRLDSVLGMGGMAVVYKATHRNQAEYAIKMLHPELSLSDDLRARFLREGYAANSVKHPGVVRVVDDDVSEDGAAFLVMELLDGSACDSLCDKLGGRIPLDAACAIAIELLDVLAAAHAKGIIHRDIKPANLFVMRDGTLKVLDFGIARVRDSMTSGAKATGTGMVLGTPVFMAPEQALGKASEVDARADIWSVGATIFALASGGTVHDAETAPQLLVKLATQPARSLAEVVPGAPPDVVAIVDCALAFDRERRWPAASAMRDALASTRKSGFGAVASNALLASLIGAPPEAAGHAVVKAGIDARPPHGLAPRPVAAFGTPAGIGALPTMPARSGAEAADVGETSSPVSRPVPRSDAVPGGRRSAGGIVAAVVGVVLLGSLLGVAFVVRTKQAERPITVADVKSSEPAEAPKASLTTIGTVGPARPESSDAAVPPIAAAPVSQPFRPATANTIHAVVSPPSNPKIAPAHQTSVPSHVEGSPVALPDTLPQQAAKPLAPATAKPSVDPLDGRR